MKKFLFGALLTFFAVLQTEAQTRYLDEVFDEVTVTSDVIYGQNITVIPALQGLPPAMQPLALDVYEPSGDSETNRPLLLFFHTGNFLPPFINGGALGTKTDNFAVEMCTRYAKKGYVVASVDYRLGWNPLAGTQEERTMQLIQAAYRGVQDCNTAVRYFRMTSSEEDNPWGIDESKVGLMGDGTGGYISLAASTIESYNDIIVDDLGSPITKFWYDPGDGSYIPMVIESIHGNPYATTDTYAPESLGGFQLCAANHVGYSSDVNFQMNVGGALGDLNWLDEGDVPMVSFQCPHDPFAPYETAILVVPTTMEPVVEVSGAQDIHEEINGYATNNNAVFADAGLEDAGSPANEGYDGLFPIQNSYVDGVPTEPYDSSPWQWWDQATVAAYDEAYGTNILATQLTLNPTMSETESLFWTDQIVDYNTPRMALAMGAVTLSTINGGVRYIDEIFDEVDVTSGVVYGENITVIPALFGMPPAPEDLLCDIYEPAGDFEDERPLILYFHTGNFLPQYTNGSALGTRTDNSVVEMCTRFARMGYVVASVDYRLGWNPLAGTQEERTLQLIQAAYRGVQDSRTAVRYFRKTVAEDGNMWGVSDDKIAMFGEGTGGYISLASATIEGYNDIIVDDLGAPISKFWYDPGDGSYIPMVIESIHGNPDATTDTYAPASLGGFQLCIANHVGYSSDFNFQMNLGGAMGDLNWLDEGDMPMVSFQCPHDPFAPYETAVLVVPTTMEPVVSVSGAYHIHEEINGYASNNNASFAEIGLVDPAVDFGNQGWDGLYPVLNDYVDGLPSEPYDSAPWQWWDVEATQAYDAENGTSIAATQLTLNPTMGVEEAMFWLDQIQDYTAPRLAASLEVVALGPGCNDEAACNYNALATSDDGSCVYAEEGYDCDGNALVVYGCTSAIACNYNASATDDDGSCDYNESATIPTGEAVMWLVGVTLTGTENEPYAAGCEADGGVNPNVALNGFFIGDGTEGAMHFSNITDQTDGLLADLVMLAAMADVSFCDELMRFVDPITGGVVILSETNGVWQSAIPVIGASYLWAAPAGSFNIGCGNPYACGFTDFCDWSAACDYTDTDGDLVLDCQEVVGCQDASADNYDETATDPGDCNYNGCTDMSAQNYEPGANVEDGSCTYLVTFRVNMSNEMTAAEGVHIAGSFQGWDPAATEVPYAGYGVHQVIIQLQQGSYEYKYINGNAWGSDESLEECGEGFGNRTITINGNTVTDAFCFNSCELCAGCADPMYAEYNPFNSSNSDDCVTPVVSGCTYSAAENYDASATNEDGSCLFDVGSDCPGDLNDDGQVGTPDLLAFLSSFGTSCE